jgi:putative SOS response-associated peptidase YedK
MTGCRLSCGDACKAWLDSEAEPAALEGLMRPYSASAMDVYPVSTQVNSVRNNGPELIEQLAS